MLGLVYYAILVRFAFLIFVIEVVENEKYKGECCLYGSMSHIWLVHVFTDLMVDNGINKLLYIYRIIIASCVGYFLPGLQVFKRYI